jgi:hypothetical protein
MARKIELLLAAHERKALFRASQYVYQNNSHWESEYADKLCDGLDDGGIWNPCRLLVATDQDEFCEFDSYYGLLFVLSMGIKRVDRHAHSLKMLKERATYIQNRSVEKSHVPFPPFLTRKEYYGPDWPDIRQNVISRDGGKCSECGLTREEHMQRFEQDLHVHHIEPIRDIRDYTEANKMENLTTVCSECHWRLENR